jgi:MAATS-type transcriptional repressor, C-terminal region
MKEPTGTRALFMLLGEGVSNPLISERIAALNARSLKGLETNLEAGIAAGEIRKDVGSTAQATLILAALRGAVGLWLVAPDAVDLAAARDELIATLTRSLKP